LANKVDSGKQSAGSSGWWTGAAIGLAVLAMVVSGVAIWFGIHADKVSVTISVDSTSMATVEELRRSNDQLLATIWGSLAVVVGLVLVVVGLNLFRGDRVIDRERELVKEDFGLKLSRAETRIVSATDEKIRSLGADLRDETKEAIATINTRMDEERRRRAAVEHEIYRIADELISVRNQISSVVAPMAEVRVRGRMGTSARALEAAITSERSDLVLEMFGVLK